MNKQRIDKMLPIAHEALKMEIAKGENIPKAYRGGISSFGAAVTMGSLLSAAAFFSAKSSGASYDREKLGQVIVRTVEAFSKGASAETYKASQKTLYDYVIENGDSCKNIILDAAVAVKLAMNLYKLEPKG